MEKFNLAYKNFRVLMGAWEDGYKTYACWDMMKINLNQMSEMRNRNDNCANAYIECADKFDDLVEPE